MQSARSGAKKQPVVRRRANAQRRSQRPAATVRLPRQVNTDNPFKKGSRVGSAAYTTAITQVARQTNAPFTSVVAPWTGLLSPGTMVLMIDPNCVQNGFHLWALNLIQGVDTTYGASVNWVGGSVFHPIINDSDLERTCGGTFHSIYTGSMLNTSGRVTCVHMPPPDTNLDCTAIVAGIRNNPHARTFSMSEMRAGITYPLRHFGDASDLYVSADTGVNGAGPAGQDIGNNQVRRFGWQQLWLVFEGLPADGSISSTTRVHKEILPTAGTTMQALSTPPQTNDGNVVKILQEGSKQIGHIGSRLLDSIATGSANALQYTAAQAMHGLASAGVGAIASRVAPLALL